MVHEQVSTCVHPHAAVEFLHMPHSPCVAEVPHLHPHFQISGIANRTSLADGNTWNHEHIALIARCLTSPEKRAHEVGMVQGVGLVWERLLPWPPLSVTLAASGPHVWLCATLTPL